MISQIVVLFIFGIYYVYAAEEAPMVAVYAIRGQTVRLPCDLPSPPEDPVILVLWYKNGTKTPVFSVDLRARSLQDTSSSRASDIFGGRARFQKEPLNWVLVVKEVNYNDQGEYRCRLDFQGSPTHNAKVHLHVVDEPHNIKIYSIGGAVVEGEASVQEGHPLSLSCRATGGQPLPNVTWWSGSNLLDADVEERQMTKASEGTATPSLPPAVPYVINTLHIDTLTQEHLSQNLTCIASNTPELDPLTASVVLKQTDAQLSVSMDAPAGKLSGGHEYDVKCKASGVRPPPIITWWLRGKPLSEGIKMQSLGPDSTVSLLRLLATSGDDGGVLECRASSPSLPHLKDSHSTKLTISYVPETEISIEGINSGGGTSRDSESSSMGLKERDSATLTCTTKANPPAYELTFMFNGRPLQRQNIVASGWSITLLDLKHNDSGLYTCLASNSEGDGHSNAVPLHIDYAPLCAWDGVREILAAVGEKVKMNCHVKASPTKVTFEWSTTNKESSMHHQDKGLSSVGWVVAKNQSSKGTTTSSTGRQKAECFARNDVGRSLHPCVFSITLVDPPRALIGCSYHDVTTDSALVTCLQEPASELLDQTYHIEVREGSKVVLRQNNSEPHFSLSTLFPGREYVLAMYATHYKGRGKETTLLLRTPTPKAEEVAPESVVINPDKNNEANKAHQPPGSSSSSNEGETLVPISAVVAGVVAVVVVGLAVVVAIIFTCRSRRSHNNSPDGKSEQYHHHASHDSLLELSQGNMYQSSTRHPSRELLTTFSPGPVVVTQVTSGRSSVRSSPLPRRSSVPAGISPRRVQRPRTSSVRGGPANVVEVESDDIMTPRVEIQSPSKSLATIRMNLRGDTTDGHQSPPLPVPSEPIEPTELTVIPSVTELSQNLITTDFQLHPSSSSSSCPPHLSNQSYVALSPLQVLPQHLVIDPVHSVQHMLPGSDSQVNTLSYTTSNIITLPTQQQQSSNVVPQTLVPIQNMFTTAHTHINSPNNTTPQISTGLQDGQYVALPSQDIVSATYQSCHQLVPQIPNTASQIHHHHMEAGDQNLMASSSSSSSLLHVHQESQPILRVSEIPITHQEICVSIEPQQHQQQQQQQQQQQSQQQQQLQLQQQLQQQQQQLQQLLQQQQNEQQELHQHQQLQQQQLQQQLQLYQQQQKNQQQQQQQQPQQQQGLDMCLPSPPQHE